MVTSGTLTPEDERLKTLELVELYLRGGALDEADALIRAGRARYPDDVALRLSRVQWLLATGDGDGARERLDELLVESRPPTDAFWLSARMALQDGRTENAIESYEHFLSRVEAPPALVLKELATAHAMSGDTSSAVKLFERAIAAEPELADARADLGLLLESLGRAGEAEAHYREALRIDPGLVAAQQGLGSILLERGELESAEELFRRSVELQPSQAYLRRNLALALSRLGRDDEAREQIAVASELEK